MRFRLVFACCVFLILIMAGGSISSEAATVTYVFGPVESASGITGSGTMTFSSPPADSSAGWVSMSASDLIDWSFTMTRTGNSGFPVDQTLTPSSFAGYNVTYNNPQSQSGGEMDSGSIFYDQPLVADEPTILFSFSSAPGSDTVSLDGLLIIDYLAPFDGDWTTVPVPPAIYLFGSGILVLIGVVRQKKSNT